MFLMTFFLWQKGWKAMKLVNCNERKRFDSREIDQMRLI